MLADYLSCIDSGELLDGISDDFPNVELFLASSIPEESNVVPDNLEIPSIPWSWYEEMFHFLDTEQMPPMLFRDQRRRLALRS